MQKEVNQQISEVITKVKDTTSNPAPLGLFGFATTTILLNLHNAGLFPMNTMILSMGLFYGGLAQLIMGVLEWKKGNTFGTVAFTSYGAFWLTLVFLLALPQLGWGSAPDATALGAYLIVWGVFSLVLFIGTFKLNRALQSVFGTLVILFFLLAIGSITGQSIITKIAGVEGIICGLCAFYTASGIVLNDVFQRTVLPLGNIKVTRNIPSTVEGKK
jgi:succinate-acetate transporter protein